MIVNYSDEIVKTSKSSIFLAGPTPRSQDIESWRVQAIEILKNLKFNGVVYVPERNLDDRTFDYNNQVNWEKEALEKADVIVFWVPRSLPDMPAFTTNVEFGFWIAKNPAKVVYGRPNNSVKNRYLDLMYQIQTSRQPLSTLKQTLTDAISLIK